MSLSDGCTPGRAIWGPADDVLSQPGCLRMDLIKSFRKRVECATYCHVAGWQLWQVVGAPTGSVIVLWPGCVQT